LAVGATNYDRIYGPRGLDPEEELDRAGYFAQYVHQTAEKYGVDPAEIRETAVAVLQRQEKALADESARRDLEDNPPPNGHRRLAFQNAN
jgi:hypothetical protein